MTVFLNAHFDAATSGDITTVNEPGISLVSNAIPTFSGSNARFGGAGALTAVGTTSLMTQTLPAPATSLHWRTYLRRVGLNTTIAALANARDSTNATIASLVCLANGRISIRDGGTVVATTTHVLSVNEWTRLEWFVDKANNNQVLEFYHGANLESNIPNEVLTGTCTSATSPIYRVAFGLIGTPADAQFAFDETALADAHIGAFAPQTYTYTVWDGASEVPTSSVTVWDGASEVAASLFSVQP